MISSLKFEHDLFGKPVSTFPDHALKEAVKSGPDGRISPVNALIRRELCLASAIPMR
jgi:hypothetical protein